MHARALALLATAAAVATAAGSAASATGGTATLTATLTGRYLHTTSTGVGTATITITPAEVCWKFSSHGLDKTGDSGIHVAPPPAAGRHSRSVFPFTATTSQEHQCVSPTRWGASGSTWLRKIVADPGRFYVIVATAKYPQGAIGGRLGRA